MEDQTKDILQAYKGGKGDQELCSKLSHFNQQNSQTFSFNILSKELKKEFIGCVLEVLSSSHSNECYAQCLQTLRIFSRDKTDLSQLIEQKSIMIILNHAGIDDHHDIHEINSQVTVEAQKCLCNLLFNSSCVQQFCCKTSCTENILNRIKIYSHPSITHQVKFFDMKLLFLLTSLCPEIRQKLSYQSNPIHLGSLLDMLESITTDITLANEQDEESLAGACAIVRMNNDDIQYFSLSQEHADLAIEALKVVFNMTMMITPEIIEHEQAESDAHNELKRLSSIIKKYFLCVVEGADEKTEELHSKSINTLTNEGLAMVTAREMVYKVEQQHLPGTTFEDHNINILIVLENFLLNRLKKIENSKNILENMTPILTSLSVLSRRNRIIRRYFKSKILPPLKCKDVQKLPEEGDTTRNRLVRLMTCVSTGLKILVAEFLFVLCKEDVNRLVKHTGYGNAAGLLAHRGLMAGGKTDGNYSSDSSNSDTEEYSQVKNKVDLMTGRIEHKQPDPTETWSEEQKEYHAVELVKMIDKMSRQGVITPMAVGPNGKPVPFEEVMAKIEIEEENSDSD